VSVESRLMPMVSNGSFNLVAYNITDTPFLATVMCCKFFTDAFVFLETIPVMFRLFLSVKTTHCQSQFIHSSQSSCKVTVKLGYIIVHSKA